MHYEYEFENSDMFNKKKAPNISTYKENHYEEPSIEAENKKKPQRERKVKLVFSLIEKASGKTAGELWDRFNFSLTDCGMKDIYCLRRILSMMKKSDMIYQGNPRECHVTTTTMFPWYLEKQNE